MEVACIRTPMASGARPDSVLRVPAVPGAVPQTLEDAGSTLKQRSAPSRELSLARSSLQAGSPSSRRCEDGPPVPGPPQVSTFRRPPGGSHAGSRGLAGRSRHRHHHTLPAPPQEPAPPSSPLTLLDTFLRSGFRATVMPSKAHRSRRGRARVQSQTPPATTTVRTTNENGAPPQWRSPGVNLVDDSRECGCVSWPRTPRAPGRAS